MPHPRIEFDLSPDFWAVSLEPDPEVRSREHRELVDRLLPDATPERRAEALDWFGQIAAGFETAGVAHAAHLMARVGDRLTIGHFTLAVEPFDEADPQAAAYAIAEILSAEPDCARAVRLVSLPCGPAVVTEELRAMEIDRIHVPLGQAQVFVKPPTCPGLVVLTMVTPTVQDLTDYTHELAAIAGSLRFVFES
jgi:hypothetical protein